MTVGGHNQGRSHTVYTVTDDKSGKDSNADLKKRIAQLEKELKKATRSGKGPSSKQADSKGGSGSRSTGGTSSAAADGDDSRAGPDTHPCFLCKEYGHWRKDCPKKSRSLRRRLRSNLS